MTGGYMNKLFALITLVLLLGCGITYGIAARADNGRQDVPRYKYYKTIEVHENDTLWSIAKEYCPEEYSSYREYIEEIKEINQLGSNIYSGSTLTIPYYSTEFQ